MLTRVLFAIAVLIGSVGLVSAQETKVVALGLADRPITKDELTSGAELNTPKFNSPGIAYVLVAHAKKGDKVEVALLMDGSSLMHNVRELEADEAGLLVQAGKTGVPAGGWPEASYTARVKITRGGETIAEQETDGIAFE